MVRNGVWSSTGACGDDVRGGVSAQVAGQVFRDGGSQAEAVCVRRRSLTRSRICGPLELRRRRHIALTLEESRGGSTRVLRVRRGPRRCRRLCDPSGGPVTWVGRLRCRSTSMTCSPCSSSQWTGPRPQMLPTSMAWDGPESLQRRQGSSGFQQGLLGLVRGRTPPTVVEPYPRSRAPQLPQLTCRSEAPLFRSGAVHL